MSKVPIIEKHTKAHKIGGSIMLPIPLEWFRAHGYGNTPEEIIANLRKRKVDFLVLGNKDIRVVDPSRRKEVEEKIYEDVSKHVERANVSKEK